MPYFTSFVSERIDVLQKNKLEILGLSSSQSQAGSFALVLGEVKSNRRLPIIIGMFEAQAIAIEMEKITPSRPMTHDLFKSFSDSFNFHVEEIIISHLKEGVFFAKIVCTDELNKHEIDARPSDAIAIALRFNAPIFTYESILSEAGIVLTDEGGNEGEKAGNVTGEPQKEDSFASCSADKLKDLLEKAIDKEDYEIASKIRDELNRRN